MTALKQRKRFYHSPPSWVSSDALFFITVNCARRGQNQLCHPAIFHLLTEALVFYDQARIWEIKHFLAMPDHWHALIVFPDATLMVKSIRDWKRFTARQADLCWQDGFFEHRLRSRQSAEEKWHYIRLNPVRKGLVAMPDDWPYQWSPQKAR